MTDSLAQEAARLRKVKRNRERGAARATAPKLVYDDVAPHAGEA